MDAQENMANFSNRIKQVLPDGCRLIGKVKQDCRKFTVDVSVPFGLDWKAQNDISNLIRDIWNKEIKHNPLPNYEMKMWNRRTQQYYSGWEKVDGKYTLLKVNFKVQKGDVKVTWENFEETVQHYNDEALGKFFFPKSTGCYDKTFDKSISVGYIEPDGTHYLYTVAAPSGILTKMSHLLAQGQTAIEIVRKLQDSAVTWKE